MISYIFKFCQYRYTILPIPVYNTSIQFEVEVEIEDFETIGSLETCLNIGSRIKRRCKISTQFLPLCKEMLPENGTKRRKLWSSSKLGP